MAGNRSVKMSCFLTLCALVSAVGQATASEVRAPERVSDTVPKHCSPGLSEPDGRAIEAVVSLKDVSSAAEQVCLSPLQKSELATRFANERLAVWRQRLNLEDWKISVAMIPRSELKPKTLGHIKWDKAKKSAVIWILDPSDYRVPFREMFNDMEFTIVHELVHLELASLPRSEASRSSEEHAVNRIAEALLTLDRQK